MYQPLVESGGRNIIYGMNFIPVKFGIVTGLLATLLAACAPAASGVPAAPAVVTRIVEVTAEVVTEVVVTATPAPVTPTPKPAPASGKFAFKYNIDKSLPEDWVKEFKTIMQNIGEILPIDPNIATYVKNNEMNIYAWNDAVMNPFSEAPNLSGQCICGDGPNNRWMVLEMNNWEFENKHIHRYAVIVHEYFHVYQIALSDNAMTPKWLVEGGAAALENLYIQQYYGETTFRDDMFKLPSEVFRNPMLFEKYSTSEKIDTGGSMFMNLALAKELQKQGISEQRAFEMIFRDFWIENGKLPKNDDSDGNNSTRFVDWKKAFKTLFKMDVETFYSRLKSEYSAADSNTALPSQSLKIQEIFVSK